MYKNKSILAIIPARGGSKGLPQKNVKKLGGKELIVWTIESALESSLIDETIVSSEDRIILDVAHQNNAKVPFVRPHVLATDTATTEEVLIHAIDFYVQQQQHFDYILLLQATSPFRKKGDIDLAIKQAIDNDVDMVVSVKETSANPYYVLFEENPLGYLKNSKKGNFNRRQDCPPVYEYNGSIYVIKTSSFLKTKSRKFDKTIKFLMEDIYSLDIDNEFDFKFAEFIIEKEMIPQ